METFHSISHNRIEVFDAETGTFGDQIETLSEH